MSTEQLVPPRRIAGCPGARWPRLIRGAWGALLLCLPRQLLSLCGGDRSRPVVLAARALGIRHLIESCVMAAERERRPPGWMIGIDGVHATSMLLLAVASPRLRRDALASAATATALIGLSLGERTER